MGKFGQISLHFVSNSKEIGNFGKVRISRLKQFFTIKPVMKQHNAALVFNFVQEFGICFEIWLHGRFRRRFSRGILLLFHIKWFPLRRHLQFSCTTSSPWNLVFEAIPASVVAAKYNSHGQFKRTEEPIRSPSFKCHSPATKFESWHIVAYTKCGVHGQAKGNYCRRP